MPTTLSPLEGRVVVKLDERKGEGTTASGLIITPATAEDAPVFGTVLAVGPGTFIHYEDRATEDVGPAFTWEVREPMSVRVNDRVLIGKYTGNEVTLPDGEKVVILQASEILALVVESSDETAASE